MEAPTSIPPSLSSKPHTDRHRLIPDLFSVVKQEKSEKADQNPENRTENSEPEWDVPACAGDGIRFCLGHTPSLLVSYLPLVAIPERAACPH